MPDDDVRPARSSDEALSQNARMLESVLQDFGMDNLANVLQLGTENFAEVIQDFDHQANVVQIGASNITTILQAD